MAFLRSRDSEEQKMFPLTAALSRMGRLPECEVCLSSSGISRYHARILMESDGFYLEDQCSRNGTFLNDCLVAGKVKLHEGDVVRLCDYELVFSSGEPYIPNDSETGFAKDISSSVYLDDSENEGSCTYKSKIQLSANRPVLTSANAAIKLQAMIDIGRNLGAGTSKVSEQLVRNLLKIFPQADCVFILLKNEQTNRLDLAAHLERNPKNQDIRISRTILEKVVQSKAAILSDNVKNDSRFDVSESMVNCDIYSMMAAPIMDYDSSDPFGVVEVDARSTGRKFNNEDLDLLVSVAYQAAVSVQNAKLQEVALHDQIMDREMTIANSVQRGLLPLAPPVIPNYGFYDFYRPAKYLAGDYYDYIPLPDGRLVFALGDVSGKGVAASLLMAKLSSEVRSGLIIEKDFESTIKRLNRTFCEQRWDNRFITFFFGVLDPKTNEIVFHNAGHIPPILVSQEAGTAEMLGEENIGLPLGVIDDTEYPETRFTIQDGQKLVIISDGVTDAMKVEKDKEGKEAREVYFTLNGVLNYLKQSKSVSAVEFGQNFINAVQSFSGYTPQTDDQSLIVVGRFDEKSQ